MAKVLSCREFERLWNERLDDRVEAPEVAARLAEHAAACDSCRCRGEVYARLGSAFAAARRLPAPSPAAVARWELAAAGSAGPARAGARRRGLARSCGRVGAAAAVAAAVLVGARGTLPLLFPIEPPPPIRADQPASLLFEEALGEATTMTLELAREVSAPARRIGSEALGWSAARKPRVVPALASGRPPDPAPPEAAGVEQISGSARHAFRFLIGPPDEGGDGPDQGEGY